MTLEPKSTAYFMHLIYQSVCLYVYPPVVARQRLSKTLPRQRIHMRQKKNQSNSYFTTGGLTPIGSSWRQESWGSRPQVYLYIYFATETLRSLFLWNILSDEKICLPLLDMLDLFQVHVLHILHVIENVSLLHYIRILCQSSLYRADHAYIVILCYNGSLVSWMVVNLTATRFKPLIFSMSGFALSCAAKQKKKCWRRRFICGPCRNKNCRWLVFPRTSC
jgi:hypothetical protein